jgi:hypothetical protein
MHLYMLLVIFVTAIFLFPSRDAHPLVDRDLLETHLGEGEDSDITTKTIISNAELGSNPTDNHRQTSFGSHGLDYNNLTITLHSSGGITTTNNDHFTSVIGKDHALIGSNIKLTEDHTGKAFEAFKTASNTENRVGLDVQHYHLSDLITADDVIGENFGSIRHIGEEKKKQAVKRNVGEIKDENGGSNDAVTFKTLAPRQDMISFWMSRIITAGHSFDRTVIEPPGATGPPQAWVPFIPEEEYRSSIRITEDGLYIGKANIKPVWGIHMKKIFSEGYHDDGPTVSGHIERVHPEPEEDGPVTAVNGWKPHIRNLFRRATKAALGQAKLAVRNMHHPWELYPIEDKYSHLPREDQIFVLPWYSPIPWFREPEKDLTIDTRPIFPGKMLFHPPRRLSSRAIQVAETETLDKLKDLDQYIQEREGGTRDEDCAEDGLCPSKEIRLQIISRTEPNIPPKPKPITTPNPSIQKRGTYNLDIGPGVTTSHNISQTATNNLLSMNLEAGSIAMNVTVSWAPRGSKATDSRAGNRRGDVLRIFVGPMNGNGSNMVQKADLSMGETRTVFVGENDDAIVVFDESKGKGGVRKRDFSDIMVAAFDVLARQDW